MTEYTTSPEVYQEYMSARERTAYWVQAHSSDPDGFYSPSIPPSEVEGLIPSSPPSDAGSSYSLPPKMVLRYNDGRPDIPIPHVNTSLPPRRRDPPPHPPSHYRSHTSSSIHHARPSSPITIHPPHHSSQHGRSGSHVSTPSYLRRPEPLGATAGSPEEIRVLPSHAPPNPAPPRFATAPSSNHPRSHHSRSKSLPRTATDPHPIPGEVIDPIPASAQSRPIGYPPPSSHRSHATTQVNYASQGGPAPWHGAHSSSGSAKHSHGSKVPPAIVYAPSHHGRAPHYAPPAILYHPPQRGPNGMIYSHSAPVPIQGGAYPTPLATSIPEERERRDRTRSLGPGVVHKVQRSDDGEESDAESVRSGSTYYVLPTPGQKVHVIVRFFFSPSFDFLTEHPACQAPSPDQSVFTATSTTKSPGPSPRKPFFQRLFSFAKIGSSNGGSTQGPRRKLQRRHSTGDSGRPSAIPANSMPESGVPN